MKRDEDRRNQLETNVVKDQYRTKLELEKDKIKEENRRLVEESGDFDR